MAEELMDGLSLDAWRVLLDKKDSDLMQLITERTAMAKVIGQLKRQAGLPAIDPEREIEIIRKYLTELGPIGLQISNALFRMSRGGVSESP